MLQVIQVFVAGGGLLCYFQVLDMKQAKRCIIDL